MALSQKHPGLMVVPWFNSHEWRYVKDCIMSHDEVKMEEGLAILQIWKCRTSKLPSGVEGTLMLLTALLKDNKIESNQTRFRCYCHALLRFLNICSAQSDKQGTFYHTAKKNDIPDWIIDFRHAIAHGQALPGDLEIHNALLTCLNWVRDKYWNRQNEILNDYIKEDHNNAVLIFDLYCNIIVDGFLNKKATLIRELEKADNTLQEKVSNVKQSCSVDLSGSIDDASNTLLYALKDVIDNREDDDVVQEISKVVVKYLCSELVDLGDSDELPYQLQNTWWNLLDLFYTEKILITLIWELLKHCNASQFYELSNTSVKLTSLWLKFIFKWLLKEKYPNTRGENDEHITDIMKDMKCFESAAMSNCNMYTSLYLHSLLKLGGHPELYIQNKLTDVYRQVNTDNQNQSHSQNEICRDTIMFDVKDNSSLTMNSHTNYTEEMQLFPIDLTIHESPQTAQDEKTFLAMTTRCILVADSTMFENCPLGALPTQSRNYNPLISFNC